VTAREPKASITTPTADEAVWRLANALAGSVKHSDVAEALALEGGAAAGGSFANMAVVENGSDRVRVVRRWSGSTSWRELLPEEPSRDAIRNGLPVLLGSLEEIGHRYPGVLGLMESAGLQAGAAWPIFAADGSALGAIGFGWEAPQDFSAAQLRRLDLVAHLTGLALDRTMRRGSDADGLAQALVALDEAKQANSRLSLLAQLSAELSGLHTEAEVFQRAARSVSGTILGDWCTIVVPRGDALIRVAAAHSHPVLDALIKRLIGSYPQFFSGPSPGVVVYRSGTSLRLERLAKQIIADLDDSAASTGYGRTLELLGDGPGLITPIITDGKVVAVLTMVRKAGEPYTDDDVETGREVAARIATFLDDARHVEAQRETASALQDASLPKVMPKVARLGLAAGYRAASEGVGVGGDWYDAFELQTGRIAAVVGDVAGHGVGAAALMAQMRNTLRAHLFSGVGLAESLHRLSSQLAQQERGVFATVICVEIDPSTGEVGWASAGHPAPILVGADGTSVHLEGRPAPPIGWMHSSLPRPAIEHRMTFRPGERLLLFTDGMIERRGIDIDIGITHLMLHAEQTRGLTTMEACETILRETLADAHEDDACLLIADFEVNENLPDGR
jgi:serine phosphatase RsbU (regulator of sigma subunit)